MPVIGSAVVADRTVEQSAQGLADYLHEAIITQVPSVVIACGTHPRAEQLARSAASVLSANEVEVIYLAAPRSAAELSFAVRHLRASAGVMISAGPDPSANDRFECYWGGGGRVLDPESSAIVERIGAVETARQGAFDEAAASGRIRVAREEIDDAYQSAVCAESLNQQRGLSILFTPLFGAGEYSVPPVLKRAGFERVDVLASQRMVQKGAPTPPVRMRDVEDVGAYDAAITEARREAHDLVLASDQDGGRLGVAVRSGQGEYVVLTGGQIAALLADYVLLNLSKANVLGPRHYIVNSPIGTDMLRRLAGHYGIHLRRDVPVGFKFIAREIDTARPQWFVLAADESHGYLKGTYAREKDAAVAALLLAEHAAALKVEGRTLLDELDALYLGHGFHAETTLVRHCSGPRELDLMFHHFAAQPPEQIAGMAVEQVFDFERGQTKTPPNDETVEPQPEFIDRLLLFRLEHKVNGFAVRPMETEPVLKLHLFAFGECASPECLQGAKRDTESRLQAMYDDLQRYLDQAEEQIAAL
jgi:phosphoglucomutase/phosphomannomutase